MSAQKGQRQWETIGTRRDRMCMPTNAPGENRTHRMHVTHLSTTFMSELEPYTTLGVPTAHHYRGKRGIEMVAFFFLFLFFNLIITYHEFLEILHRPATDTFRSIASLDCNGTMMHGLRRKQCRREPVLGWLAKSTTINPFSSTIGGLKIDSFSLCRHPTHTSHSRLYLSPVRPAMVAEWWARTREKKGPFLKFVFTLQCTRSGVCSRCAA